MKRTSKYYKHATEAMRFLTERHDRGEHQPVRVETLMEIAGVSEEYQWKSVKKLMERMAREIKADLVNPYWGGGYAIAARPEQTVRDGIKSVYRSFAHNASADRRFNETAEFLKQLTGKPRDALHEAKGMIKAISLLTSHGRKELDTLFKGLNIIDGAEREVTNIEEKLLLLGDGVRPKVRVANVKSVNGKLSDRLDSLNDEDSEDEDAA